MRVATVNVNGIRASHKRGFATWLETRGCDVVAIQEMRCRVADLPQEIFDGWHLSYDSGQIPGRNGVALLTRQQPQAVRIGFQNREFADEGRYIEVDIACDHPDISAVTFASLYLPKGATQEESPEKYDRKMRFMAAFSRYLTSARRQAVKEQREFVVMGDFNIAHTQQDLKNWRSNQKSEGFLPEERAWFSEQLSPHTLVDVVRSLHPDENGPYSWWSWRGQAFTNDTGWRIDYHLATPGLAKRALSGGTDREASYDERLSDHAPVVVDYDLMLCDPRP
ncbi:MAG: exodeoxyribonuclease III [Propionibacteriaceae bacterium]